MLRLSPFCAPISVICLILVVPEVDTTVLPVVVVGERHRGLAVAERDRAGVLDLLERAGEVLRERRASGEGRRRDHRKQHFDMHWSSPL